jgi:hypothetical protein
LLLGLATTSAALGQPTVELEVQTDQPYVNQPFWVKVRVHNAQQTEVPDFPDLPNCNVDYVGPESRTYVSIDNTGRKVISEKAHQYMLVARQAGVLTIPPIPVAADGRTLRTKLRRLTVRELPESPSPRDGQRDTGGPAGNLLLAEITCAQSKLFVGQHANFTLTVWIKPAEYRGRPLTKADMWTFRTGSFGPFDDVSNVLAAEIKRPGVGDVSELYYVYELTANFVLQQTGPLTFSDVAVGMNYPTQFSRNVFGDLRVIRHKRVPPMHPAVTVPEVQPLPTEGRPASFSGAVGNYELNIFAIPTNVRVGDPIQLVIDISGDLIETLPAPDLTSIPQLIEDFRVPGETLAGTVSGNRKRFTQTIRAKRADVKQIPPIEFAYFDPEAERYVVARSEPIPVLVSAVEQLDAADLTITAEPSREHSDRLEARDGLRGNRTSETELLAVTPTVTMTQVALTTVIPPAAFGCVWGLLALARSGRDRATQRRRAALREAERRIQAAAARKLPPGEFHGELQAALAGYLADRLDEPPARFLGRAAIDFLQERGVDEELVQRCAELLQRCEQAAYAGGSGGDSSLAELARQCARQLERERL